jgi:hypothetical protein
MSSVKHYEIDENGINIMKHIKDMLDDVKFQTSGNRKVLTHDFARPYIYAGRNEKRIEWNICAPYF